MSTPILSATPSTINGGNITANFDQTNGFLGICLNGLRPS